MILIEWTYNCLAEEYLIKIEDKVVKSNFLYIDGNKMLSEDGKALIEKYDVIPGQVTSFYGYCTKNGEIKKPPLGVMPCWLYAETRIRDLAGAITRQLDAEKVDLHTIKQWANEIMNQCELIERDKNLDG